MPTWAIGDVHGCWTTLEALLGRLEADFGLDLDRDALWLVGDLVNRGPRSLETLRWARDAQARMGGRFVVVLGNHDLHLLARWSGFAASKPRDSLDAVLAARDVDDLCAWLAEQPFLHRDGDRVLVHAGLWPDWTLDEAVEAAERLSRLLRSPATRRRGLSRPGPEDRVTTTDRRAITAFVQLRTCTADGVGCRHTGAPATAPPGCLPWFEHPHRRRGDETVVCGHWAALGLRILPRLLALDSACVWGRCLTAVRLEDRRVVQQPTLEPPEALPGD